jgi:hypothetical protein
MTTQFVEIKRVIVLTAKIPVEFYGDDTMSEDEKALAALQHEESLGEVDILEQFEMAGESTTYYDLTFVSEVKLSEDTRE